MRLSSRAQQLRPSTIRAIAERAGQVTHPLVRLDIGEPDFPEPAVLAEVGGEILGAGSSYLPTRGLPAFRERLAEHLTASLGDSLEAPLTADAVHVTAGGSEALTLAFALFCDAGDTVLLPSPGYPGYGMFTSTLGVHTRTYALDPEDGWRPDLAAIEAGLADGARVVVVNSPNNPTGSVVSREDHLRIVELARAHDAWVVADEVYHAMQFSGDVLNAYALAPDRTIGVYSFSKTYSMTGYRLGVALVPEALREKYTMLMMGGVSSIAQEAGLRVLDTDTAPMHAFYAARQELATKVLEAHGLPSWPAAGTFYRLVALPDGADDMAVALALVEAGVVAVPGSAFGELSGHGTSYLRLSLTRPDEEIERAVAVIAEVLRGGTTGS
ncbi:pyridoxal phosphate-dependent aminotransferase [Nocardioides sp. GY 10127]|uniref:pyridoxal phosphate-dependent aminotransferase n=1 Tax=Nocardioides sp. GY 10127 TaxID=2569762 RepID=UPI001458CD46|nr:pyridoxal phosphate-dependent aminotransferase [Nocardioides sp. GY 10127]